MRLIAVGHWESVVGCARSAIGDSRSALIGGVSLVLAACATVGSAATPDAPAMPQAMLARAIDVAGGEAALRRARVLEWDGDATVHAGARNVEISGHWTVVPPDSAIVDTYAVAQGPATRRALAIAAPNGWVVRGTQFTPLPAAVLANERDAFFLYSVMLLAPLSASGVRLTGIGPDSVGQRGFRAEAPDRPAVDLYVDATGRLSHVAATIADAEGGAPVREDLWLDGSLDSAGIRWPRTIRILLRGVPYFDLTLRTLEVRGETKDARLKGPGA
ncbi:MAG: hypothetical protein ABJD07_09695 [Gemmatimonadaceae bacterium]